MKSASVGWLENGCTRDGFVVCSLRGYASPLSERNPWFVRYIVNAERVDRIAKLSSLLFGSSLQFPSRPLT